MKNTIRRTEVIQTGSRTRIRDPFGRLSTGYVARHGSGYIVCNIGAQNRHVQTLEQGIDVLCARIPIANGVGMATIGLDHHARG